MKDATRVVRAGVPEASQGQAFLPGPTFASVYHTAGDPASSPLTYGRFHNPTWSAYERALSALEGGPTLAFASGMAAIAAVFGSVLRPGDRVIIPSDSYYTTRVLSDTVFREFGVVVEQVPTVGDQAYQQLAGAKLLWLETPSNPSLDVADIQALAEAAHTAGALVGVDNTTATVLGQQPLALGADFSVASDTKALTGHSDLVLGHVSCRDASLLERVHIWRTRVGAIPGPMEVWLAHRSLATLDVRLERQGRNAMAVASYLANRGDLALVRYPGLPQDRSYAIAQRQMRFFGPVVSFDLETRSRAEAFFARTQLFHEATSFGGVHSSAERRARWGGDAVSEGFIRMSVGLEDADDLIADLEQALQP